MRKALIATVFLIFSSSYAFNGRSMSVIGKRFMSMWTWMGGPSTPYETGAYGNQGSSAATPPAPGARQGACTWTDSSGNKWFFGGYSFSGANYFNDLWKYNVSTNEWSWISGSSAPNGTSNYGVQGVSADTNVPGAREYCMSWVDTSGNLWLFGGDAGSGTIFNDLWKYNPTSNQWTWMTGSNTSNATGTYGTQGVAAPGNTPGARFSGVTWIDTSGNLWLSGGSKSPGYFNDLWKFNPTTNQWTWVHGSNQTDQYGVYGTKGSSAPTPPVPGSRLGAASWTDSSGNLWIFGGVSPSSNNYFGDLWKYNPTTDQWTWISGSYLTNQVGVPGTKGVPSTANIPTRRAYATTWVDGSGKFWLFGGMFNGPSYHNSLWKFDPGTLEWTWVAGSIDGSFNPAGVYGTKGVAAAANTPGARYGGIGWSDGNKLWMYGGSINIPYGDLWMYDISAGQWTWMSGTTAQDGYGVYGTQGSSAAEPPVAGSRSGAVTWIDSSGNQWTFGGQGAWGTTNDLWKYNPSTNTWTWISGTTTNGDPGNYGTKGVAAASNSPRARAWGAGWIDSSNNLWVFGGFYSGGYLNDLWKFDPSTGQWTWMSGASSANSVGTYGTKGTPSTANIPGARVNHSTVLDSSGNFWLYGGSGYASAGTGYLNDLWKYNPGTGEWTWISGANTTNAAGVYGTKGTPSTSNYPGGRTEHLGWIDGSNNIWIFGGRNGTATYLNDLWRFNPGTGEWTWMTGSSSVNPSGVYGTKGTPAAANTPGGRALSTGFKDSGGNFWVYGGSDSSYRSDLWKYNPGTNQWTWMSGANTTGAIPVYGIKGVASTANTPGARSNAGAFVDSSDNLWMFGGIVNSSSVFYGDLWKYNPSTDEWTWVSGSNLAKFYGVYGTLGTSTAVPPFPGSRHGGAGWIDSSGNLWMFGGYGNGSTSLTRNVLNDLWKYNPTTGEWMWMSGSPFVSATGVYGSKGVAASSNIPGARYLMAWWKDSSDKLWLLGGNDSSASFFNDLWKYDPVSNQWTWISGNNTANANGVYGTRGVPSTANAPGARRGYAPSIDASGNFWFFGGYGYGASGGLTHLNDVWKYNPSTNEWTWIFGATSGVVSGVYGTKGSPASVPLVPGCRYGAFGWRDSSGRFWMYGGFGVSDSDIYNSGYLGDLWMYDPATNQWGWFSGTSILSASAVYGTKGVASTANIPGGRRDGASWVDTSDNLWLFGGTSGGRLNDLWKYNPTTTEWTWVSGPSGTNAAGTWGTKGVPSTSNIPDARYGTASWSNATNTFWLFGGYNGGSNNDFWKYNVGTNEWTWVSGSNVVNEIGTYGTRGSPAPVPPSPIGRAYAVSWVASNGTLWMFGGNNDYGNLNDLWKYNTATGDWTWVSGSNLANASGTYGTKGTPSASNVPGARNSAVSWSDSSGNLWMFGGNGFSAYWNDLWKYDTSTSQWTWISGASTGGGTATYGTKGTPNAANVPGARYKSTSWRDNNGNLWLFGGTNGSQFNDLWKYDPSTNQWTWMTGSNTTGAAGVYGTQGVADPANTPGARYGAQGWVDASGNLWLFGGVAGSYLSDLWKYDVAANQWTWMSGPNTTGGVGSTGTLGIATSTNQPRSRYSTVGWADSNNNLWLFSGNSSLTYTNDLWRYNITTNQWTWMTGTPTSTSAGTFGTLGVPSIVNTPGCRQGGIGWKDLNGNFWVYGGYGYGATGVGDLGDLWRFRVK
ncbi:kelch repeat-containing protein [Bdellovibrio sp. HCB-162]|uniref:Kelch repeat-containing protein n=1 Tax=Bdellovibrio sp. HCB-162 TaxID=3394234 RepID=UPI0039BCD872